MKKLICPSGNVGSGKTTIAEGLSEEFEAPLVHVDTYKRLIVDPTTIAKKLDPPLVRWNYYELALGDVFIAFGDGKEYVVMDEMFHVGALRTRLESRCARHDIAVYWIEVRCADDVVRHRIAEKPRANHILDIDEMFKIREMVADVFDPFPQNCRHFVAYNDIASPGALVADAANWVRNCH